ASARIDAIRFMVRPFQRILGYDAPWAGQTGSGQTSWPPGYSPVVQNSSDVDPLFPQGPRAWPITERSRCKVKGLTQMTPGSQCRSPFGFPFASDKRAVVWRIPLKGRPALPYP